MFVSRKAWVLGLLAVAVSHAAWAQSDVSRTLLEQGRYWQAHGKPEQAEQSWSKLLTAEPAQPEALYGMGAIALGRQQLPQAQEYLAKLRAAAPASRFVLLLEQDLRLAAEPGKSTLEKARQMAQDASNQNDAAGMAAAIAQYDRALGGKTPQGAVAREYYTYLGYVDGGLDRAIQGLQRLNAERPDDPAVMLPLAQHMARDETRRADGIRYLEKLSSRPDIGGAAAESWRAALGWLGAPRPEDKPLFEDYLKLHPDDAELRRQMQQVRVEGGPAAASTAATGASRLVAPAPRQDARLTRGFAALKGGDIAAAEQTFADVLRDKPDSADALGGLGVVRMEQNDLAQAESLLSRAAARPGGGSWNKALNTARYWSLVNQAGASQSAGDLAAARRQIDQALRIDPRDAGARNALGRLYAAQGDQANAEKTFRGVLASDPNNRDAVSGLVDAMAQSGRAEQAQQWVDSMTPAQQAGIGGLGRLRAAVASGRAKAAEQRGDQAGARQALEDARRNDPDNPWIRLDLARYYLDGGARDTARRLVDELVAANPNMPDALYASALLSTQMGDWTRAHDTLARIPAPARTPAMVATARQVDLQMRSAQAAKLAQDGSPQEARALLARLEPEAGRNPALLGGIAQAYVDAGDYSRGLGLLRPLMPNGPGAAGPDVLLPYAGLLLKAGQDAEASGVLRQLQGQSLTRAQRRQLDDLNYYYAVRQAEQQRQRGDLAGAYDTLAPVLSRRPDDRLATGALARLYADGGKYEQSLALYKQMVARDPDNGSLLVGAALAAAQAQDYRYADAALERAITVAPDDPEVLSGAARVYLMRGKSGRAAKLLEAAIASKKKRQQAAAAADRADSTFVVAADGANASAAGRPNAGRANAAAAASSTSDTGYVNPFAGQRAVASVPAAATSASYVQPAAGAAPDDAKPRVALSGPAADPSSLDAMQNDLQAIRAARSPEVRAGVFVQSNNGAPGTSKLTTVQEPMEARLPLGEGKLALRVTPVQLNAGTVGGDAYNSSQLGGGPVAARAQAAGQVAAPGAQRAHGVGLAVGYEAKDWKADIGTTPLGFEHSNVVGGAELSGAIDPSQGSWYSVGASRRAVTDSLVSFAGTRDPRTGDSWGAVTATGVQGQVGIDRPTYGVYGYGSLQYLSGKNVASNNRSEVGVGAYRYLTRSDNSLLTAGLNLGGMFYSKNERYSTYGSGGYFSPQSFYSLSVPLTWAQRSDRFSYKLQGSVGLQHYRESSVAYFPTSAARQTEAVAAAAALGLTDGAVHPGQSATGVGYNLAAAAEYRLTDNLTLGGALSVDNASHYRQWGGGLSLRYSFEPQTQSMDMPVTPYHSPYSSR